MNRFLAVGLGGFLGSMLRYALGTAIARLRGGGGFPLETLVINVLGCLAIGFLGGVAEARGAFSDGVRQFLFVGLLGGFTTFSALGYETFLLARNAQVLPAVLSVALQVTLGLGAVWAGHALAGR